MFGLNHICYYIGAVNGEVVQRESHSPLRKKSANILTPILNLVGVTSFLSRLKCSSYKLNWRDFKQQSMAHRLTRCSSWFVSWPAGRQKHLTCTVCLGHLNISRIWLAGQTIRTSGGTWPSYRNVRNCHRLRDWRTWSPSC